MEEWGFRRRRRFFGGGGGFEERGLFGGGEVIGERGGFEEGRFSEGAEFFFRRRVFFRKSVASESAANERATNANAANVGGADPGAAARRHLKRRGKTRIPTNSRDNAPKWRQTVSERRRNDPALPFEERAATPRDNPEILQSSRGAGRLEIVREAPKRQGPARF